MYTVLAHRSSTAENYFFSLDLCPYQSPMVIVNEDNLAEGLEPS